MARVLLVDDSMYQRNKLRKTLELAGYEVLECNDGEEGLSMVASIKPDCVMLDLIMPKAVSYTHLRAHETVLDLVCRLLLEQKKK